MECNKEEAVRAKNLAETKLQNKDFAGARKLALKAQQLYTNLEKISQVLIICDVHCAAEQKILGTEMDWYGILKIEKTADDITIKKQFKKFALLLHPDKNQFPGAEAAFKLIEEAQRILLDKGKRSLHDMKCKVSAPSYKNPQRPTYSSNVGANGSFRGNVPSFNPQQQQRPQQQPAAPQPQPGNLNNTGTFWTACPFCQSRYQYYLVIKDRSVVCQNCHKPFVAHERSAQGVPISKNFTQPVFQQRKDAPPKDAANVRAGPQGNTSEGNAKVQPKTKPNDDVIGREKANGSRRRKKDDFIESSDSDSSSTDEETLMKDVGDLGSFKERPRRSVRSRHQVSYTEENQSDDEDLTTPRKKAKGATGEDVGNGTGEHISEEAMPSSEGANAGDKNKLNPDGSLNEDEKKEEDQPSALNTEKFVLPDPDFSDFDQFRDKNGFKAGQIWAIYDTHYGMPRFHARITRVLPGFKLKIKWLEPKPDDADEREWAVADLPVCCGKFKLGKADDVEDHNLFSHLAKWEKGSSHQHSFIILPKKGEIWALYKNWDIGWKSDMQSETNRRVFEYDFVEVLSDFSYDDAGVSVVYLGKLKGFVSLFCRVSNKPVQIKPNELFRFSHLVPSFTMTGEERADVPKGSFELDPASLPEKMEEIDVPKISEGQEDGTSEVKPEVPSSPAPEVNMEEVHDDAEVNEAEDPGSPLAPEQEILDPEFFNFDGEKAIEKLEPGQIWSLYSDEDSLPKYYARVIRVSKGKSFSVRVTWLESAQLPTGSIQWADPEMPVCCGKFKLRKGRDAHLSYDSTGPFSHLVNAEPAGKNLYNILPAKGEIWALYRNWSYSIPKSEIKACDYDVVEVVETSELQISVRHLERVKGFNSVFRARAEGGEGSAAAVVKMSELLRFSHYIPAFRLTDQKGGILRGFWELDSAALPVRYFT